MSKKSIAKHIVPVALCLALATAGVDAQPAAQDSLATIAIVHGRVIDRSGQPLKIDQETLQRLQAATLDAFNARTSVPAGQRARDAQLAMELQRASPSGNPASPRERVLSNAVRIGALASQGKTNTDMARILRANTILAHQVLGAGDPAIDLASTSTIARLSPDIARVLDGQRITPANLFPKFPFPFPYTYSRRCALAGVPVPPAFNSNGSTGWHREGVLNFSILNPGAFAELYTWSPATGRGLCMALPIRPTSAQPTYDALGIICQGISNGPNPAVSNSGACFWDNAVATMVPNTTYPISGPTFISPPNLPSNNQCSDCHAGENAFITHTGSVIESAKNAFNAAHTPNFTSRNNWYKPLLDATWPQNPEKAGTYAGGAGLPGAPCASCHTPNFAGRLPDVTGAAGSNPGRDKLFLFCWAIASGEITSGTGPHAASVGLNGMVGPMNSHTGAGALTPLQQACSTVIPVFMGFPATDVAWINW